MVTIVTIKKVTLFKKTATTQHTKTQAHSPAVCVQTYKVLLLKRHAKKRDLVSGLVCCTVQPLGLEHNEDGLHKVLHPALHVRAVIIAGVKGHICALLLSDLSLQAEHQQTRVVECGTINLLLAVEAVRRLWPLFSRGTGGHSHEAHHLAVRLKVAPLVVLGRVVVTVTDVELALRITHAHLVHTSNALVDAKELFLWHNAHRLHHHKHCLVVLSALHVVRDAHGFSWRGH